MSNETPPAAGGVPAGRVTDDLWQLALDVSGIGVWEWDLASGAVWWSHLVDEIVGLPPVDEPRRLEDLLALFVPESRSLLQASLEEARHNRPSQRLDLQLEPRPGAAGWLVARFQAITTSSGEARAVVGTFVDISERKGTEQARERAFQEEQRARSGAQIARERLQFLASAASAIRAVLEPDAVRRTAVELVAEHLGDWGLILDRSGRTVEAGAGGGLSPAVPAGARHVAALPNIVAEVAATGDPQVATVPVELSLDADTDVEPVVLRASTLVAVPLVLGSNNLGMLVAGHGRSGRPYDTDDLELFTRFAESLAGALTKADLFEERSAVAEALQQSLLPASLPPIEGFEVGTEYIPVGGGLVVGGDFYDVFRASEGHYAFAIGDVSGKGAEAAAVTALVRHSIRAYCEVHRDPAAVLTAVNAAVRAHRPSQRYCTVVLGLFSGDGSEILLAVGGHPLPLRVGARGVEPVGTPGTLIGTFAEVELHTETVRLGPGESLVLYTDGITEARRGEVPFGEERLASVVGSRAGDAPQIIATSIGTAVTGYRDHPDDDVAVLVLRRLPR